MSEEKLCSKCNAEPVRAPGQRYGAKCHALAAQKYRREHFVVPRVSHGTITSLTQAFALLRSVDEMRVKKRRAKA